MKVSFPNMGNTSKIKVKERYMCDPKDLESGFRASSITDAFGKKKYCPKCKSRIGNNDSYCNNCRERIS